MILQKLIEHIDKQIGLNSGKNLFAKREGLFQSLKLSDSMLQNLKYLTKEEEDHLIDYISKKSLMEFYKLNQYYYFTNNDVIKLRTIYVQMLQHLKSETYSLKFQKAHYYKLRNWLAETNPFANKLYPEEIDNLQDVVCEEYQAGLQLEVLHLDLKNIKEPILDIGCGKNGALVKQLRELKMEAFGFDRVCSNADFCLVSDWFEHEYGKAKWGTIISNLSFSNHFNHHHLRSDGNYVAYAQTNMQILDALQVDGSFHYAPDLPFIEEFLKNSRYKISTFEVAGTDFKSAVVKRLF